MRFIFRIILGCLYVGGYARAENETLSDYYEIAKANCHDIGCIRSEMDRINNQILQLLAERTAYVKRAGDLKSQTTKIADDRKRVADQENKIIEKSKELELPTEISLPAFRAIVEESIKYQQRYIDELTGLFSICRQGNIEASDDSLNHAIKSR